MKLAYLYGIEPTNSYLSTYSHYPITKKFLFVNEIFTDKPLLIVGVKRAKEIYPNQIDLDKNHIKDNIYWCYSPEEYLSEFLKKYEDFILNIHNSYLKIFNFEIIDLFFKNINEENQIINFLSESNIDIYYHINKMVYCYSNTNNKIYIINLNEFFWFNKLKIDNLNDFLKNKSYYNDSDYKIYNYFTNLFQGQDNFFIEKSIAYFIYINKH